jgi:hypothetical protein
MPPVMVRALKRRVALLLLGLFVFAQVNVALAACSMDSGMLGQVMASTGDGPCGDCGTTGSDHAALSSNLCVAHCTSDLQLAGAGVIIVAAAPTLPALVVRRPEVPLRTGLDGPPSGAPPRRILLHSFLI